MRSASENPVMLRFGNQPGAVSWQSIGDPVMGGRSSGRLEPIDTGASVFRGEVSLANGGGFASVKTDIPPQDLSRCRGLRLTVQGDGKTYKLGLRMTRDRNAPVYQHAFATETDQWHTVELAFAEFVPRLRGRTLHDAPPLDPSAIASVSLFISGGQAGPFALHLKGSIIGV